MKKILAFLLISSLFFQPLAIFAEEMESHPEPTISTEVWQTWAEENKPEIESSQKKSEESFSWNITEANNSITRENIENSSSENISEEEKSSHEKSTEEAEESDKEDSDIEDKVWNFTPENEIISPDTSEIDTQKDAIEIQNHQPILLTSWNLESSNEDDEPTLIITEAFFDKTNARIEISNTSHKTFSWMIKLTWNLSVTKWANKTQPLLYNLQIPWETSIVLTQNSKYFTTNFPKKIIKDKYTFNWKSWLNLTLTYWNNKTDSLIVHPDWTQFLEGKDNSFEKVLINGKRLTTRTTIDRIKNIKWKNRVANPWTFFTEAENAKDISLPKEKQPSNEEEGTDIPISCNTFIDRNRLEVQEIFRGNNSYPAFIELKWTDTPAKYKEIMLTGTILAKEIVLEKTDFREKNSTFIISKDETRYDKGIDSQSNPDFNLLYQTWYLTIQWFDGQTRQVLDTIILTAIAPESSSYTKGEKAECFPIFNTTGDFSPGFEKKFLDFFKIDSKPKIEYITINWGGSCHCPSKEELCTSESNKQEKPPKSQEENKKNKNSENKNQETSKIDINTYQVKIEDIEYDPPGADTNESITLILTKGEELDLSLLTLDINGKNKKLKGILKQGISETFRGSYWFPNSSKNGDTITVHLKYKEAILDTYYYKISSKQKKEIQKPEGIKVFSIIDGDTIRYKDENRKLASVRLIWVDAPESNTARYKKTECYGKEAKDYLTQRLKGKTIELSFDKGQENTDRYGRLLAYVSLDGKLINEELIRNGYAKEYTYKQSYEKQEAFKKAEYEAKNEQLGIRDPKNCPDPSLKDEEKKNNVENLIIKIQNIEYNPKGSDKNNESITLSIFDKSKMIKSLDFNNQFWLFILEKNVSGMNLSFEDIEGSGKFKDLSFLWNIEITNPLILKGDFWLPNTKSSCIALVQNEHLFDIACYDIEKKTEKNPDKESKQREKEEEWLSGIILKIHSITPNPKGKDLGKEKIEISFTDETKNLQKLLLWSGFYLLINQKNKKYLSWELEEGKPKIFEWNFNFPNTNSCISIGKGNQIFDTFCYTKAKEGVTYTSTNEILQDFTTEERSIIKATKLIKEGNKYCIQYKNQNFICRNIPNTRKQQEKQRKIKFQARESAFFWLENMLKTEYSPRYQQTKVSEYFSLAKKMKSDLKNNIFSTNIDEDNYEWKTFPKIFEKEIDQNLIDTSEKILKKIFSSEIRSRYEEKKQQRIAALPDTI